MRREQKLVLALFGLVDCVLAIGAILVAFKLPATAGSSPTLVATFTPLAPPAVIVYTGSPPPTITPLPPVAAEVGAPSAMTYTVVNGDTLWGLAVRFKVSLAALMAANPYMNPDQLQVGQVIVIPLGPTATAATPTPTPAAVDLAQTDTDTPNGPSPTSPPTATEATPTPTATFIARVVANGQGLRFRRGPGTAGEVFAYLDALTPLVPLGRTPDNAWLDVTAPEGRGWVMAIWVELFVNLDTIPVEDVPVVMATDTPTPLPTSTQPPRPTVTPWVPPTAASTVGAQPTNPQVATNAPPPAQPTTPPVQVPPTFPPPGSYPLISGITDHSRQIFLYGQSLGNRANIFSKVGDSITANDVFLTPIGWGIYDLRQYTYLAPVIAYFSQTPARTANSFANTSLAARGGWAAWQLLNPGANFVAGVCGDNERPIECEYRVVKPSIALIMIGTNDVRYTTAAQFEAQMRLIIQITLDRGIIPVVSTIPPLHRDWAVGRVEVLNGIIVALAREYDIPLWDYWSALQGLPNDGLSTDGVHPSVYSGHAADFSQDYIQAGYTVRNLLALQALDAVWQAALH